MNTVKTEHRMIELVLNLTDLVEEYNMEEDEKTQEEIENSIERVMAEINQKFDNTVAVIEQLKSKIEYAKAMKAKYQLAQNASEKALERLKDYLLYCNSIDPNALKGESFAGKVSKRRSVGEVDLETIDSKWKIVVPESYAPDKKAILNFTKNGNTIDGVEIITKEFLRIGNA